MKRADLSDPIAHIKENVIPFASQEDCPPVYVLAYAIREIAQPTLNHSMIPDLLKFLAMVEQLRQKAVDEAACALSLATGSETSIVFTKSEKTALRGIADQGRSVVDRNKYRFISLDLSTRVSNSFISAATLK